MPSEEENFIPIPVTGYYQIRGGKSFCMRIGKRPTVKGKAQRYKYHTEKTKDEAEAFILRWNKQIKQKDPVSLDELTRRQKAELIYCLERVSEIGLTLKETVDIYMEKVNPLSLKMPLSEAYNRFEKIQYQDGVKERGIKAAKQSVYNRFIRFLKDKPVGLVTKNDIRNFLGSTSANERSRKNYLTNLSIFFSKLIREDLNADNPCAGIVIKAPVKISEGYKPWEIYAFLNICIEEGYWRTLAAYVLTAFCGLRIEESIDLEWEDLDLSVFGYVDVKVETAKTSRRRTLILSDLALGWLARIPKKYKTGKIATFYNIQENAAEVKKICKAKYPEFRINRNMARQAFSANHFAKFRDIQKLRMLMGNSPNVIETNYNGLVKPPGLEKFYWSLYEPSVFVKSLPKALKLKLWKNDCLDDVYNKDFGYMSDLNDENNPKQIVIPNKIQKELQFEIKANKFNESEALNFSFDFLKENHKELIKNNDIIWEANKFERKFKIRGQDFELIENLVNTREYLESNLGHDIKYPKAFEEMDKNKKVVYSIKDANGKINYSNIAK